MWAMCAEYGPPLPVDSKLCGVQEQEALSSDYFLCHFVISGHNSESNFKPGRYFQGCIIPLGVFRKDKGLENQERELKPEDYVRVAGLFVDFAILLALVRFGAIHLKLVLKNDTTIERKAVHGRVKA
jgi:hypothetical protein